MSEAAEILEKTHAAAKELTEARDSLRDLKEALLPHLNTGDLDLALVEEIKEMLVQDRSEATLLAQDFKNILELLRAGGTYHS